jgi:hypothetical protein
MWHLVKLQDVPASAVDSAASATKKGNEFSGNKIFQNVANILLFFVNFLTNFFVIPKFLLFQIVFILKPSHSNTQ